ncbi:putative GIY-YIG superfamily endonuclease/GNAT superfamily N-acetyltransferase [Luteimonas terrae]|uniref:GIY-YIG superfamily endonuclease/GNAT superfamily N-acetyltransferase n=2 Tax=Luteimonas terrae TaxID=1530191 RepID=A0ABU1XW32_9GAMM|nr:putative GIY-YIG superfamily endonuclease/GNAT superfamily N-acetyltransferase [Luteimonas terrae]
MTAPSPWHLYLLECRNGSWYAGITNDLDARFAAHAAGRGAKYTRGNPPVRILASRSYPDRASASRAEWQLKRQPRARKLAWLQAAGSTLEIRAGGLDDPRVVALLQTHLDAMALHSPPESIRALDLSGLRAPGVSFWGAWRGDALAGCGALKDLGDGHGELKSMRTDAAHLRQGVAAALLAHLMATARAQGWQRLSLETGTAAAFAPAHALYARHGFTPCGPFGDYIDDPFSTFMTRSLDD